MTKAMMTQMSAPVTTTVIATKSADALAGATRSAEHKR
jgi:hypothetical protein